MDIMPMEPMVTTMARGPLMPSPRLRLRLSMALMVTLTVWDTTLAMLGTDMLATPSLMVESPPPTCPWTRCGPHCRWSYPLLQR